MLLHEQSCHASPAHFLFQRYLTVCNIDFLLRFMLYCIVCCFFFFVFASSCVSTTVDPFWDISLDLGHGEKENGRNSSGASAASTPDPSIPGL